MTMFIHKDNPAPENLFPCSFQPGYVCEMQPFALKYCFNSDRFKSDQLG